MRYLSKIMLMAAMLTATFAQAAHLQSHILLSAKLTGAQEVPAVATTAVGVGGFTLNGTRDSLSVNVHATGLSGPIRMAHIHIGLPGVSGPVVISLNDGIIGNRITKVITGSQLTPDVVAKFLQGQYYINIHTTANPTGEIRGQILLETDLGLYAPMSGLQEVPATPVSAKGLGTFVLSHDRTTLKLHTVVNGLSGPITGAHLHIAPPGVNGPVSINLTTMVSGNVISGTTAITSAQVTSLLTGNMYINVHTTLYPGGEIRGQVLLDRSIYFDARLDPTQETTPPVGATAARGVAHFSMSPTFDTLTYHVQATNLTSNLVGAHLHEGALGVSGPVVLPLTIVSPTEVMGMVTGAALTDELVNDMLSGNIYVNLHTVNNPGGEIRGQVYRVIREGYTISVDGEQQVPSVSTFSKGAGIFSVDRDQTNAHFMVTHDPLISTRNGIHFHRGAAGTNGAVIFDLASYTSTSPVNPNGVFGYWNNLGAALPGGGTASALARSNDIYFNTHSTTYPGGEIRGQVLRGYRVYEITYPGILAGTYTINRNAPFTGRNFTSIAQAGRLLTSNGINLPVILNVVANSGPYLEQAEFGEVQGSEDGNTITLNGNGNVLRGMTNRKALHILKINGTDFLTINNLVIESAPGAPYGWGIHLINDAQNVTIQNSTITVNSTSTSSRDFMGIVATSNNTQYQFPGNNVSNLTINNNLITGGNMGIRINGDTITNSGGIIITGNTITNPWMHGISLNNLNAPIIGQNVVTMRSGNMDSWGILLEDSKGMYNIYRNRINNAGAIGLFLLRANNDPATIVRASVRNNMVGGFQNTSEAYGIAIGKSNEIDLVHNSVNLTAAATGAALFVTRYSTGIDIRNNSLAYTGSGAAYAMRIGGEMSAIVVDYNNYYSTGTELVQLGQYGFTDIVSLMADTLAMPAGHDQHSKVGNPNYASATDLHASGNQLSNAGTPIPGVFEDYDGNQRSFSTPDIGADEFAPAAGDRIAAAAANGAPTELSLYPNPVSGNQLNLATYVTEAGTLQIVITDLLGRETFRSSALVKAGEYKQQLQLPAEMGTGLYLISVQQGSQVSNLKFRKQ